MLVDGKPDNSITGISYFPETVSLAELGQVDLAIKSPGFKPTHPILILKSQNVPIISEIGLAREFLKGK